MKVVFEAMIRRLGLSSKPERRSEACLGCDRPRLAVDRGESGEFSFIEAHLSCPTARTHDPQPSSATYRTSNYLASCVMSGAAAESILLAVAIAKVKSEQKVLAEYKSS